MILSSIVSLVVTRWIVRPLGEMKKGVERIASGDLSARLPVPNTDEFATLAEEMNSMASQLEERMKAIVHQRNELEAVLSSMVERVIAFDGDDRIITINNAAADLLDLDPEHVAGKSVQEAIRNTDLQAFIERTSSASSPIEGEIVLHADGERFLQIHGTPLEASGGERMGALLVLNDLTRIRTLERIRRDFVANASHEIRTPVTSIKGFVETLLEGAIDDPEVAHRFLEIIGKHSDRLNTIVEDLLSLSRIEREAEDDDMFLETENIGEVVEEAVEACHVAADAKGITVRSICRGESSAFINRSLLVQALINLIDNAIKYSEADREVLVQCESIPTGITVSVKDNGCGIAPEHLPRLFERFYRVDKSRSRDLGGTGLGLSIVKHIVQSHGGKVDVSSEPGKGSVFTIYLKNKNQG
ncbi:MAG: two-component system histidine kinase PnpS [bacterium]